MGTTPGRGHTGRLGAVGVMLLVFETLDKVRLFA